MRMLSNACWLILVFVFENCDCKNRTLDVFHLNEYDNPVADASFAAATKYLRDNGYSVIARSVTGRATNYESFFTSICKTYSGMLDNGSAPDFVLDNTVAGIVSACGKSFTRSLSLPTISSSYGQEGDLRQWDNITEDGQKNLIQILSPTDILPFVIRALITFQNYTTAAILADESYVMDFKYKCLLENVPARHYIADLDASNPINQLIHIKKVNIFNIFVLGSAKNIKLVLDGADAIGMYSKDFSWHAITHENEFARCDCRNAKIVFAKPVLKNEYASQMAELRSTVGIQDSDLMLGFYYDLAVRSMLAASAMMRVYTRDLSYITCEEYNGTNSPHRTGMDFRRYFVNENVTPSFGPIIVTKNGFSSLDFQMELQAYTFREGTISKKVNVGTWRAGYENLINFTSPNVMMNYTSFTYYRIVAILQKPFLFEDPTAPKKYSGYCIDLLDSVAAILNFDYDISEVVDGRAGNRGEEGEWNGVVRELLERRADIGIGSISITEDRLTAVEFTVPIFEMVGHSILMKVPQEKTSLFRFINIFDLWVWIFIILFYFLSSLMLTILFALSPFGGRFVEPGDRRRRFNFTESMWFCLISFTPQGAGEAPSNWSGRVVTAAWWFFTFMMFSSYSANLSAFLTVSRLEAPIKSLDELANQYKIQYAPLNDSETMRYFKLMAGIEKRLYDKWIEMNIMGNYSIYERSQFAVWDYPLTDRYTKLWNNMQRTGLPSNIQDALQMVQESKSISEGFAFLGDATDIKYFVLTNCDYQMVGEEFHKKSYGFATQKGSPLKSQLSNTILQLLNQRQMEVLKEKWWSKNPERAFCDVNISDSIGIANIGGVFIFLGVGMVLFVVACLSHMAWAKIMKRGLTREAQKKK